MEMSIGDKLVVERTVDGYRGEYTSDDGTKSSIETHDSEVLWLYFSLKTCDRHAEQQKAQAELKREIKKAKRYLAKSLALADQIEAWSRDFTDDDQAESSEDAA